MARPKSDEKRNAIVGAAIEVFAERGLGAPTSAVSKAAGVAEGSLFTYFSTKDELLNALYRELKLELGDAMMSEFPRRTSVKNRLLHVWSRYVDWGLAHPREHRVLRQIEVWSGLTAESKMAGMLPFLEIQTMMDDAVKQKLVRDLPLTFMAAAMSALAETTIEFMRQSPKQVAALRQAGFEMLWAGVEKRR